MDWKKNSLKFNWKKDKDKLLILLLAGVILLILGFPMKSGSQTASPVKTDAGNVSGEAATGAVNDNAAVAAASAVQDGYEAQMEKRVKQILKNVEGVGEVDVMIVLKSSEEKIVLTDKSISSSITEETDQNGGVRKVSSSDDTEEAVLTGSGGANLPFVEKELRPEMEGIIISAEGGGSPQVKAEISEAMEALFGVPSHKIKVLKRAN